jgi:hypothetical protein
MHRLQFATATEDAVEAAAAALPKDPKARAAAIKQAQEDMEQVNDTRPMHCHSSPSCDPAGE